MFWIINLYITVFFIKKSLETFTANIYKVKSGYNTVFYDFYGCVSSGRTLEETVNNAKIALQMHIDGMLEDGEKIIKETYYTNWDILFLLI